MVVGNFNTNLESPEGQSREEEIAVAMATARLKDMSMHFLPRRKPWSKDSRTWGMLRGGQKVRSRTNYILGT